MKKLFSVLFCTLVMSAPSFAKDQSYEIGKVAAPDESQEAQQTIIEKGNCFGEDFYRKFIEVVQSDLMPVEYYSSSGTMFSNPFLNIVVNAKTKVGKSCQEEGEGEIIFLYENGQKLAEINFKNGKAESLVTYWFENAQKRSEGNLKNNNKVIPV